MTFLARLLGCSTLLPTTAVVKPAHIASRLNKPPERDMGNRFERLITPWRIFEYPGTSAFLAQLCGVSHGTAWGWIYKKHLPLRHARRLADYFERLVSECESLVRKPRAYAQDRTLVNNG